MHLVIDSTGSKLFGQGEWDEEQHGRTRRSWRKLHLAFDADTGEIAAAVLTSNDLGDAGQVPVLLEQVDAEVASVTADGAYPRLATLARSSPTWCQAQASTTSSPMAPRAARAGVRQEAGVLRS